MSYLTNLFKCHHNTILNKCLLCQISFKNNNNYYNKNKCLLSIKQTQINNKLSTYFQVLYIYFNLNSNKTNESNYINKPNFINNIKL